MSTFLDTIQLILADAGEVPGLPPSELISVNPQGSTPTGYPLSERLLIKIARLQTLCAREEECGSASDFERLPDSDKESEAASAAALAVQEDSAKRLMYLEWTTVEVVRKAFPVECERFGVRYFLDAEKGLLYAPERQRRFLD